MKRGLKLGLFVLLFVSHLKSQEIIERGRISGMVFCDYYYNALKDSKSTDLSNCAINGKRDMHGFSFRRINLAYDYMHNDFFTSKFRVESDGKEITSDGKLNLFVRDAYLKASDLFDRIDIIIGIQPTLAFEISESYWGNRFIEKTIMDLRDIQSSRDFGLSANYKIDKAGKYKLGFLFGNNSGLKIEKDKYKRYSILISLTPIDNSVFTLFFDYGANKKITSLDQNAKLSNNSLTFSSFIGYKEKQNVALGLEGFMYLKQNGYLKDQTFRNKYAFGVSLFAEKYFAKNLSSFLRWDFFDTNIEPEQKSDSRNFCVFGIKSFLDDNLIISPNVLAEFYEKLSDGDKLQPSLTVRATLMYRY